MVDPTSASSPSLPPVESNDNDVPSWWILICPLFAIALLCLYFKLTTGSWCGDDPPHQPQRRARRVPAPAPRPVVVKARNDDVLISFTYKGDNGCAVCLCAFEEGEQVKQMPKCKHWFHARCIDTWLGDHVDCPLCRSVVVAPPVVQPHR